MELAAEEFATIIFLNVPNDDINVSIGINYFEYLASQHIKRTEITKKNKIWGIGMIPPGAHFVTWSVFEVDKNKNDKKIKLENNKRGEFVYLSRRQVFVFIFENILETFIPLQDENEIERYKLGHERLDFLNSIVTFSKDSFSNWNDLSYLINLTSLQIIQPTSNKKMSSEYNDEANAAVHQWEGITLFLTDLPPLRSQKINKNNLKNYSEITKLGMDHSDVLNSILESIEISVTENKIENFSKIQLDHLSSEYFLQPPEVLLLSEFQIVFIRTLLAACFESLMQWKKLLILFSNCEDLATTRIYFFSNLIRTVYSQIEQMPNELMCIDHNILCSSFIVPVLISLVEISEMISIDTKEDESVINVKKIVKNRIELLKQLIQFKFKMTLEELWTLQEDGPSVVDVLDESKFENK